MTPRGWALARLVWCLALAPLVVGCVESDVKLTSLAIDGAHAVSPAEVRRVLATQPGGRWPWSSKAPFDQRAFEADLERIRRFYADRGYPDARIDHVDLNFNRTRDAVAVVIRIGEGQPLQINQASFVGFDRVSPSIFQDLDKSAAEPGRVRDRAAIAALRQRALDLLREHGYAYATVDATEELVAQHQVNLVFTAKPGPATTFGAITIAGATTVSEQVIRRQLTLAPGQPYRPSAISFSQRRLAGLEILRFANVDARLPADGQPTSLPVQVTVAEDKARRLELGVGYGTEDRARGSVDWSHLNFFGDARRLTLSGKFSAIDRGGRASFSQPYFLHRGLAFDASGVDWWTRERIYNSRTYGGRAGVTYRLTGRARAGRARPGARPADTLRVAYVYEFLRYTVKPDTLQNLSNVDQLLGLGLDPVTGIGRGTKTAIAADYEHTATDNLANPRLGWTLSLHGEGASPALGGTFRYNEATLESRAYVPIGSTIVAAKVRAGSILARSDADVPFSDRYFLGGASSLRGWSRYQVAPLTNGIPIGGRTMVETSFEWRVPVRGAFGLVGFVDVGNAWAGSLSATTGGFRSDAGFGIRYRTPIGLLRGDAAQQLNSIDGLIVNGKPETRTWRLHVSIGQAF